MNEQILSLRLKLESMQTELQALLELDTRDADRQLGNLLESVRRFRQLLKSASGSDFEKLARDASELEESIRRATQAKEAMKRQSRMVSAELDVMQRGIADVQRGILFIARDAPYGFMGVANNIEVLIDTLQRLKAQAQASGQSFSSLALILQGIIGLFTTPTGILALLSILILSLKDVGAIINRLTRGAFAELLHSLRELGKAIGFVDDFREGFGKFKDLLGERANLENLDTGFKLMKLQVLALEEQNKRLEEQIEQRRKSLGDEELMRALSRDRVEALKKEMDALEAKKKRNETILLLLKEQVLREGEIKERLEGELEARERIDASFRDRVREIKRAYEEELTANERIRDELVRRQEDLNAKQRELTAELKRQDELLQKGLIARRDYEDEVLKLKKEQAQVERERLETEAEMLRRNTAFRIDAETSLAKASAMRIQDDLLRQEQLTKIEMARNAKLLELQEKLRKQGALTESEFEKEKAAIIEAQARLRFELQEIENKKIERNIELRKQALALQMQIVEKQREQAALALEQAAAQAETMYDTDIASERLILFQEEMIALKREEFELDMRRRKLAREVFNESAERARFEMSMEEMRLGILRQVEEISARGLAGRNRRYMDEFGRLMQREDAVMDLDEMRVRSGVMRSSVFREDAQRQLNEFAIQRLEQRIQSARRALELARSFGTAEDVLQAERNLASLELRLAEMQSMQISAMSFLQLFGAGLADALEKQIRFNSAAAELERERTKQQLAEERRRIAERRALLQKEYEDIVALTNEQVGAQQISQAEAAQRLSEFEQKRLTEFEELKKKETEIAEREQRLQAQSFAKMVLTNITNSMVQLLAQMLIAEAASGRLNLLTAAFVVPAAIAAVSVVRGMLEGMMTSYAEGRMFDRPTAVRAVVGDAQRAGQPVNMEALLNAAQLAEFGRRYAEQREQVVIVNLHAELNATKLVEEFETQKIIYNKLKVR